MKQKRKQIELSTEHIYSIGDIVELTWLGDNTNGIIMELTYSFTSDGSKIATYKIKDMYDNTIYPVAGINENVRICNIIKKIS